MSKTGRLTCFALALCQIAVGCRGSQRSTDAAADPASAAKTEILIQLNERSTKIVDFTVAGVRCSERCDQPDAPTQPYRLQMRSPGYFRIELPADQALIAFDGKALLSVDHRHRTQQRIDLGSGDQSLNATLPYQALNPFLVEGWRAPLLAVAATELRGHLENAGGHRI
ncbi:MAG: hypothetical protein JXR83_18265, partial [Deltaproteobacteria bacterium]|nr:hypothetical protein [Deltaproteobacteria bacterium]